MEGEGKKGKTAWFRLSPSRLRRPVVSHNIFLFRLPRFFYCLLRDFSTRKMNIFLLPPLMASPHVRCIKLTSTVKWNFLYEKVSLIGSEWCEAFSFRFSIFALRWLIFFLSLIEPTSFTHRQVTRLEQTDSIKHVLSTRSESRLNGTKDKKFSFARENCWDMRGAMVGKFYRRQCK